MPRTPFHDEPAPVDRDVTLELSDARLEGHLTIPRSPAGVVLFAHGSGSSRLSPRNIQVAERLHASGVGTLLFDLLTYDESRVRAHVFDIARLAQRLVSATRWLQDRPEPAGLSLGYFGASTGAAAAVVAAAHLRERIAAVVSRGGRPDLAMSALSAVRAPTLLIVGSRDPEVLELNRLALTRLTAVKQLTIVPGAGHLFEEPGTLEQVGDLAADWFAAHLAGEPARR